MRDLKRILENDVVYFVSLILVGIIFVYGTTLVSKNTIAGIAVSAVSFLALAAFHKIAISEYKEKNHE